MGKSGHGKAFFYFLCQFLLLGLNSSPHFSHILDFSVENHQYSFLRGKGDFYRLGHGCDQHYREPKLVEGLQGKKIIDIAVGVLHCLAVSDNGEVRKNFAAHYETLYLEALIFSLQLHAFFIRASKFWIRLGCS